MCATNSNMTGGRLHEFRLQRGLSLTKLADRLGLNRNTLARYERLADETVPRLVELAVFAYAANVTSLEKAKLYEAASQKVRPVPTVKARQSNENLFKLDSPQLLKIEKAEKKHVAD